MVLCEFCQNLAGLDLLAVVPTGDKVGGLDGLPAYTLGRFGRISQGLDSYPGIT